MKNSGGYVIAYISSYQTGGAYDPKTDTWRPLNLDNVPKGRFINVTKDSMAWSGAANEMVMWGGHGLCTSYCGGEDEVYCPPDGSGCQPLSACFVDCPLRGDGAHYDPAGAGEWRKHFILSLSERRMHTTVWADGEVIWWGGNAYDEETTATIFLGDGMWYDPVSQDAGRLPTENAPSARSSHMAVWTGEEMIVWGGGTSEVAWNGAAFRPPPRRKDVNRDGRVDGEDLSFLARKFGAFRTDAGYDPDADVNGDGLTGAKDLFLLTQFFGERVCPQ
jgi:hypothetical protein